MPHKKELQIGGRTLSLETGAVARQANGACVIRYGDTVVIATACFEDGAFLETGGGDHDRVAVADHARAVGLPCNRTGLQRQRSAADLKLFLVWHGSLRCMRPLITSCSL